MSEIKKLRKAVVPAAGFGTRFLPATKAVPKELLPIVDRPIVQYIVEEAVKAGVEEVIFVLSRGKDAIADHFDETQGDLVTELQEKKKDGILKEMRRIAGLIEVATIRQGKPKGLGHAVLCARNLVGDEPFAVLLGDDIVDSDVPCARQLIDVFERTGKGVVAVQRVKPEEVKLYGIVEGTGKGRGIHEIKRMVEKPDPEATRSNLAIIGRYILPSSIFSILETTKPGKNGEIQLTDALQTLAEKEGMIALEFEGERFDAGDRFGFIQANIHFGMKDIEIGGKLKEYLAGFGRT